MKKKLRGGKKKGEKEESTAVFRFSSFSPVPFPPLATILFQNLIRLLLVLSRLEINYSYRN